MCYFERAAIQERKNLYFATRKDTSNNLYFCQEKYSDMLTEKPDV